MRRFCGCLVSILIVFAAGPTPGEEKPGIEFFEAKVRPVLVQHCYECHSAEAERKGELKGSLRLDTREAVLRGGDTGPSVVPGEVEESPLIAAVRYVNEDLKMPPKGKLPDEVIADLEKWVAMGAPDPRDKEAPRANAPKPKAKGYDFNEARQHWAYRPITVSKLPAVARPDWPTSPIDHYILAKLDASGLSPSPPADRRTLLRRAYIDLIGLPPTHDEVEAFERDTHPQAFEGVVDRLLASPAYGERWARHWLDVARYADTKDGVLMYGDDRIRPYAYTYRDYTVRAMNDDLPYDRFVHEQLAADLIEPPVEPWRLAALGFLTLGRMFDNNIHDVIDDRIDVATRGLLGLTVACARCHDHKYDAIPTADYYSLYGVFASSDSPSDLPLIEAPQNLPGFDEFEKQVAPKRQELDRFLTEQHELLTSQARLRVADYLVRVATTKPDPLETAIFFLSLAPEDLRPQIVARWRRLIERRAQVDDPVFGLWAELLKLPNDSTFVAAARQALDACKTRPSGAGPGQINPLVRDALTAATLDNHAAVARAYGELLRRVDEESRKAAEPAGAATQNSELDKLARQQLLEILAGKSSPGYFSKSETYAYMSRAEKDKFGGQRQELDKLAVQSPNAPPRAMVLRDSAEPYDPRVFVRGNPAQPGEPVHRQFLRIVGGDERHPFPQGSGRLNLAQAITDPANPLTRRVLVNRVWMHHFGEPLVATPSDFGMRSAPPSHPELLDFLAAKFLDSGWSLKKLHRLIVLSSVYQQASQDRPECRTIDPENRWLWRSNRRRLDFEAMRDGLLAHSGRLQTVLRGRPVDLAIDAKTARRTLYGLVDRQSLPSMFRAFDFANPDQSIERRVRTIVPQQALFAMNSPFAVEQAKGLADRPEVNGEVAGEARVRALYRVVLARQPEPGEVESALQFVKDVSANETRPEKSVLSPWQQLSQVLLLTNESFYVD